MRNRRLLWLALGALAYPVGMAIGHLIARRDLIYPYSPKRSNT